MRRLLLLLMLCLPFLSGSPWPGSSWPRLGGAGGGGGEVIPAGAIWFNDFDLGAGAACVHDPDIQGDPPLPNGITGDFNMLCGTDCPSGGTSASCISAQAGLLSAVDLDTTTVFDGFSDYWTQQCFFIDVGTPAASNQSIWADNDQANQQPSYRFRGSDDRFVYYCGTDIEITNNDIVPGNWYLLTINWKASNSEVWINADWTGAPTRTLSTLTCATPFESTDTMLINNGPNTQNSPHTDWMFVGDTIPPADWKSCP